MLKFCVILDFIRDYSSNNIFLYYFLKTITITFSAKIEWIAYTPSKSTKNIEIWLLFGVFSNFLQFWLKISNKVDHSCDPWVLLVLLTPLAPLGRLSSGDIWVLLGSYYKYWSYKCFNSYFLGQPVLIFVNGGKFSKQT